MRWSRPTALLLFAAALTSGAADEPARVRLAEDWQPPVLDGRAFPAGLTSLTVSPDGLSAAAAVADSPDGRRGRVLLYSSDSPDPVQVEVNGVVRDLLFEPDSRSVLGLLYRPAKRREGDTYLLRIDLDAPKPRRVVHLPDSARGIDYWPLRGALLVAVRNEIRTFTLPGLRSGPLYRVPGENLAVASMGQGSRVLIGQDTALLLVDLDAPPGEDAMPVLERRTVSRPVTSLAADSDGTRVLARLDDGSVWTIETAPLRAELLDDGALLADTERAAAPPTAVETTPTVPTGGDSAPSAEPVAEDERVAGGEPIAGDEPTPADVAPAEEEPLAAEKPPAAGIPEPNEEPAPAPPPTAVADDEPGAETTAPADLGRPQVRGAVGGPAAGMVAHVVFFGPDNILKEALRVVPDAEGNWRADGLAPGRYRVQLDAGGQRVLVTEPAFVIVVIPASGSVEATAFRVLEAL